MSMDMIEVVARAIAEAGGSRWDELPRHGGPGFGLRSMYVGMARAALEAYEGAQHDAPLEEGTDPFVAFCRRHGENPDLSIETARFLIRGLASRVERHTKEDR